MPEKEFSILSKSLAIIPSPILLDTVLEKSFFPPVNSSIIVWNIPCIIFGTPAKTNKFSTLKPGAAETGLSINVELVGMIAIFWRASLKSIFVPSKCNFNLLIASVFFSNFWLKALATDSVVMSSWVGPIPPHEKT